MSIRTLPTAIDYDMMQPLGRIFHDAFEDGFIAVPVRNSEQYHYAYTLNMSSMFPAGAVKKSYLLYLAGSQDIARPVTGDSHAGLLQMGYSNYAPNDASYVFRGINLLVNNYTAGVMGRLEGALISVRQRKNSGALGNLCAINAAVEIETPSPGAVGTQVKGIQVDMRLHGNCPANSAGVCVRNNTDGVYTVPTAGFALKNDGTSSCPGFTYGLDFYDAQSTVKTWNIAPIRLAKPAAEDVVIVTGNFVDGADSGFAPGSLGLDTTDGLLFVSDSAGLWQVVTV